MNYLKFWDEFCNSLISTQIKMSIYLFSMYLNVFSYYLCFFAKKEILGLNGLKSIQLAKNNYV